MKNLVGINECKNSTHVVLDELNVNMKYIKDYKIFEFNNDDYIDIQDITYDISDNNSNYNVSVMRNYNGVNIIIDSNDYSLMDLNYFSDIIKRLMEFKPEYNFTIKLNKKGLWTNLKIIGDGIEEEIITPVITTDHYNGTSYVSSYTHTMGSGRLFNLMDKEYYSATQIMIILTE